MVQDNAVWDKAGGVCASAFLAADRKAFVLSVSSRELPAASFCRAEVWRGRLSIAILKVDVLKAGVVAWSLPLTGR